MTHRPWESLKNADKEVFDVIESELKRQSEGLEMIASENFASQDIVTGLGNPLTNKYAEGRPGKRYYGGCEEVDKVENLAIDRLCSLFGAKFANVQPHSGASANAAVYLALLNAGDKVLGLDLSHGGHLTHGSKVNFSGLTYDSHFYQLDPETEALNYDAIKAKAVEVKPKMIIAGASAYARQIDFKKFREIADEVGAILMVDMAHIAGLVAAGLHQNPVEFADVVTSTTHKTLRGPRGGVILWNNEKLSADLNKGVFPGSQGGPLEHVIAMKAVCFKEAASEDFKTYQKQVIENAQAFAHGLMERGFKLVSGGTDNHLILMSLLGTNVSGKDLEIALGEVDITVNKNTVPNETRSPFVTSGIRFGTPALTTRGLKEKDLDQIAGWVKEVFDTLEAEASGNTPNKQEVFDRIRKEVHNLAGKHPLYKDWN
ncbi:serine hydroxymethyltransferase [bacterium]|nr:serine hydroxymethyltransferase [bacterium]